MTQNNTHRVTGTIRVLFDTQGVSPRWLEDNLRENLERAIGDGLLTGHTEAEVDEYAIAIAPDDRQGTQPATGSEGGPTHAIIATLAVAYAPNGISPKWLEANLEEGIQRLVGEGGLTGHSAAYADDYTIEVKADAPVPLPLKEAGDALASALSDCLEQIDQMRGMFNDKDGAIAAAVDQADAAYDQWKVAAKADTKPDLSQLSDSQLTDELRRRGLAVSVWSSTDLEGCIDDALDAIPDISEEECVEMANDFLSYEGRYLEDHLASHGNDFITDRFVGFCRDQLAEAKKRKVSSSDSPAP